MQVDFCHLCAGNILSDAFISILWGIIHVLYFCRLPLLILRIDKKKKEEAVIQDPADESVDALTEKTENLSGIWCLQPNNAWLNQFIYMSFQFFVQVF